MRSPALLAGVRILELGDGIAGSVAAATMAELGATVFKAVGSDRRHATHTPRVGAHSISAITATLDRAKTLVNLDQTEELAAGADIVLVDMVDQRMVVPRPKNVQVTITPFGLTGPYSGRSGES